MDRIPCPGCRTLLEAEVTACPICLRPRSKYEITRAYATLREMQAQRRKRPFVWAAYLLILGGLGYGAWRYRVLLLAAYDDGRTKLSAFWEQATDARRYGSQPPADAAASSATAVAAASAPNGPTFTLPTTSSGPAPAAGAPPAPGSASAAGAAASAAAMSGPRTKPGPLASVEDMVMPPYNPGAQWAMRGRVYNLLTLLPAPGVQLVFRYTGGGAGATANTDGDGRYAVIFPRFPNVSFEPLASDPQYANAILCEPDIPYKTLSLEERKTLIRSAQDGDLHPTPLTEPGDDALVRRDLFLAPHR